MKFLSLEKELFGLDISDVSLKLVKLRKKGKSFALSAFNEVDIDPGIIEGGVIQQEDALVKIIKVLCKNVKGKKLTTKYVAASLPEEKSFLQIIQMPLMQSNELASAVSFEAENYIPLPVSDVYLDFQTITPLKTQPSHLDVLIVATPKKIVNAYVSCLQKAGLVPLVFEVESQAIARAMIKNEVSNAPVVIVDFGKTSTIFIVFAGTSIQFTCSIPVSSQQITEAIAKALQVDTDKAEKIKIKYDLTERPEAGRASKISQAVQPILENFISQIKKYLNFYQDHATHEHIDSQEKIAKILLCGGGAKLKGLTQFLSERLSIPVELGDFFTNVPKKNMASDLQKNALSFSTALGLALRAVKNPEDI